MTTNDSHALIESNEKIDINLNGRDKIPFGLQSERAQSNENVLATVDDNETIRYTPKIQSKKAISLEKIDDTVKKFISGEIIIDKENPFKKLNAKRRADFFSSIPCNLSDNRTSELTLKLSKDEFVSKEDVLKESKYVRTYIKNPDEYFVYDPTLKERLLREERQEFVEKHNDRSSTAKKSTGSRISRLTHERLKELKSKYSPSPLYTQQQKVRVNFANGCANGGPIIKLPKTQYRKVVDRGKYPDLSQIKVKTGTDFDGSFFNPKEVAINAKKFDARIKNQQFGSQDDLDEIADLTSDFDANGFEEVDATTQDNKIIETKTIEANNKKDTANESLTTTISSKEFQKYLADKGLLLQPEKINSNGIVLRIVEKNEKMASPTIQNAADAKKLKKPSVLQRLFPNGFFSSRRRTTPTPEPIKVNSEHRRDGRLTNAKRLVLHRQSMPANCNSYANVNTNLKAVCSGGSSSSISSTLTNVENSEYLETNLENTGNLYERKTKSIDSDGSKSLSGLRYIDSSSNSTIVTCDRYKTADQQNENAIKPIPKPRNHISGRSSVPLISNNMVYQCQPQTIKNNKEIQPIASQRNKTYENRDIIKPRVCRPKIPISNLHSMINNNRADVKINDGKKINGLMFDGETTERKKRIPSKLPERLKTTNSTKRNLCETSFDVETERIDAKTPDTYNESNKPKSTSTPITENVQPKFHTITKHASSNEKSNEISLDISPIPKQDASMQENYINCELRTPINHQLNDKNLAQQFYAQPLLIQAHSNASPIAYSPRVVEYQQTLYDRLPVQNNLAQAQPLYAKVEKSKPSIPLNAQFLRNTPHRQSLDQIKIQPNQAIYYQQPVFIRNSPQRNTISGVYRGNIIQRMSPQIPSHPITIIHPNHQQQPQRPQSVLDEMMHSRNVQSSPSPSIQYRHKQPFNRNEVMNQVIEFCRKSMNKTPTKFIGVSNEQIANIHKDATSSEVSPISYASVATSKTSPSIASSRSGKIRPQVPIRKQSLQPQSSVDQNDSHPIYERISGQQIPIQIVNNENRSTNGYVNHYAVPPKRYVIMESEHVTPAHVKRYHQVNGIDIRQGSNISINQPAHSPQKPFANRIHLDTHPYEYVRVQTANNGILSNNLLQIYHPNSVAKQTNSMVERKFTPIMLPTIPQHQQINGTVEMHLPPGYTKTKVAPKPGRIVVLNNVEQMYRPIAMPAKTVRHQTSQTSLDAIDSVQLRSHSSIPRKSK